MSNPNPTFQELQDELMALIKSTKEAYAPAPHDPEEYECVTICADLAASCVEGCPSNDEPGGKKCVIACGRAARQCIRACNLSSLDLGKIDALLQAMESIIASEDT